MKTLQLKDVEWFEEQKEKRIEGPVPAKIRTKYTRECKKIRYTLELLTRTVSSLPERQLSIAFNRESLEPLIDAILSSYKPGKDRVVENRRVFKIAAMLLVKTKQSVTKGLIKSPFTSIELDYIKLIQILNRLLI